VKFFEDEDEDDDDEIGIGSAPRTIEATDNTRAVSHPDQLHGLGPTVRGFSRLRVHPETPEGS
jgi:hypothetical protein